MAPIAASTEAARPAEEAFADVIDPSTMSEWQQGVVRGHLDTPTTRVGSRCTTIRRIGRREREVITEITEYDPPRRWADRGISGPIRAIVAVTVEPLADSARRTRRTKALYSSFSTCRRGRFGVNPTLTVPGLESGTAGDVPSGWLTAGRGAVRPSS